MDAITNVALPMMPKASVPAQAAPQAPLPGASKGADIPQPIRASEGGSAYDAQAAEAKRAARVQKAAQIANLYVISDQRFTIFKDATGQYITKFTSLRDGRVTYIPEPDILAMARRSAAFEASALELTI